MPIKKTMIVHESYAASLFNDVTTFGMLAGMFWVNKAYLDSAIPEWVLTVLFFLSTAVKVAVAKRMSFTNREDAIAAIEQFYGAKEGKNDD